jgi:predicted transcriptional regulator
MSFTIDLDEKTARIIRELAAAQNRSAIDIIREALAAYSQVEQRPLPKGMGKYRSGDSNVSADARDLVRDAVRKGQWP